MDYLTELGRLIREYEKAIDAEHEAKRQEHEAFMKSLEAWRKRYNAEMAIEIHKQTSNEVK